MGQVGKIKRLISHKLVAGKRIPGSQFAVQRFHHLEIVISQILDGKNTAGLPGQSNQIIYDKSISNQLALDKENAALASEGQPTKPTKFETDKEKLRQSI